jgi:hypothetical protein
MSSLAHDSKALHSSTLCQAVGAEQMACVWAAVDGASERVLVFAERGRHAVSMCRLPSGAVTRLTSSAHGHENGPALSARFQYPTGVCALGPNLADGLVVCDSHSVRILRNGQVQVLAGAKSLGCGWSLSGPVPSPHPLSAASPQFAFPTSVLYSKKRDSVLLADRFNHCIKAVRLASGNTTIVAVRHCFASVLC